jgi:hypothetical protein
VHLHGQSFRQQWLKFTRVGIEFDLRITHHGTRLVRVNPPAGHRPRSFLVVVFLMGLAP